MSQISTDDTALREFADPAALPGTVPATSPEKGTQAVSGVPLVLPPPDGGFHAWAQVVSGHLVVALTWGYASSFGVFQNYYEATLPQSPSDISWVGGFQVFCLLFISTLSGRATDAGLAWHMTVAGTILLLLGTFMTSLATEYWQIFLAQGLCTGIGQGLMWLPSVTLISTYFVRKRVFAVTAAATGTSTGGMIFPAMIQHLTPRIGECGTLSDLSSASRMAEKLMVEPKVSPGPSAAWASSCWSWRSSLSRSCALVFHLEGRARWSNGPPSQSPRTCCSHLASSSSTGRCTLHFST